MAQSMAPDAVTCITKRVHEQAHARITAVIERVAVLVDGGHGRRTAPVAYKRVAVPSVGRRAWY